MARMIRDSRTRQGQYRMTGRTGRTYRHVPRNHMQGRHRTHRRPSFLSSHFPQFYPAIQYGNPPSHSICASSPRAAGVNSALSADSRSSRSNARYWARSRVDWVSNNSALVTVAYLAQIPTSRNLDNPCTLRAKIRDARRLQDAAVECRG